VKEALVFEDDALVREDLSRAIESSGWRCASAPVSGGEDFLKARAGPDLKAVFVSLSDGIPEKILEAARLAGPGPSIVAVVDLDRRSDLDDAMESGLVDEFIPLPFSRREVQGVLRLLGGEA
jgi:DNA-binding response OmpR family regulator